MLFGKARSNLGKNFCIPKNMHSSTPMLQISTRPPRYSLSAGEPSKRLKAMHSFPPYLRIPASCQFSSSAFCTFIGPVLLLTMQANCWKWFFMFLLMLTNLPCCLNCHLQSQALSDDQAKVQPALRKIRCHTPQLRRLIKQQWNHSYSARFIYFHGSE